MKTSQSVRIPVLALVILGMVLSLLVSGCNSSTASTQSKEDPTVKVGVLGIIDVLPVYVAEKEGFFKAKEVQVEILPFRSAIERDTAMQTGQLDIEINDLISAALLNKTGDNMQVVRTAMKPTPNNPMFAVLAAPNSGITTLSGLKSDEVAISNNTIIEYVTDSLFSSQGVEAKKTEIAAMPVRLEMLQKGQVKGATLPEPLASSAIAGGAKLLAHDGQSGIGLSTVSASTKSLQAKPGTIKKFLEAYEMAVKAINENPEKYRELMIEVGKVPASVSKSFAIPPFPKAVVPSEEETTATLRWMVKKGLLTEVSQYGKLVNGGFLPKSN